MHEIKTIDWSVFDNLEYLSISGFKLRESPFQNSLQKLIRINIENCDLSEFNFDSLNSLTSLQIIVIDMSTFKNKKYIKSVLLIIDLNRLINLKWLDLKFFQDERLFHVITNSSNQLTKMILTNTTIDLLKQLDLSELKCLEISNVNLSQRLSERFFDGMASLVELVLKKTSLLNVDFLDTARLRNLEKLDLSHNQITFLRKGAFDKLAKLKRLNLSYNQISELVVGVFEGLECLEDLNISSNQFYNEVIDKRVFDGLICLKNLYIMDRRKIFLDFDCLKRDGLDLNVYF